MSREPSARRLSRVLAVDYGTRRVGLALSDPGRVLAGGLPTLDRRRSGPLPDALARIAREHEAAVVVLGLPLNMDGSRGPRARQVEALAGELRARLDVPVTLWDERLSTVRAHRVLREAGIRARAGKAHADRLSAVLILQNYLDAEAHGAATRESEEGEREVAGTTGAEKDAAVTGDVREAAATGEEEA